MGEALNKARELDATYVMHTYGRSKLFVTGEVLAALPGAEIVEGLGV